MIMAIPSTASKPNNKLWTWRCSFALIFHSIWHALDSFVTSVFKLSFWVKSLNPKEMNFTRLWQQAVHWTSDRCKRCFKFFSSEHMGYGWTCIWEPTSTCYRPNFTLKGKATVSQLCFLCNWYDSQTLLFPFFNVEKISCSWYAER